jgi:glycosyltransferase involved in cell wall biosynthesis
VLVLNHFAVPAGSPGGTRHVELFGRLGGWSATIVAADWNILDDQPPRNVHGGLFTTVRTVRPTSSTASRIFSWVSYAVTATARGLRGPRPSLVYGSSPHLLAGLAAWFVATVRRVPFVLEVRDLWPRILAEMGQLSEHSPLYRALAMVETFLYRRADAIVVLASGVGTEVLASGIDANKIHFIPNGADPDEFTPSEPTGRTRERLGLTGTVVAYTGAHGRANGLGAVLDAADELRKELPEVQFVLVGGGTEKRELMAQAAERGLDNVHFVAPIPKQEVPDLLAAADVGLHVLADVALFRYGVSPNKLFDYMAAGLPVLTNVGGDVGAEVVRANAGLVVTPDGLADGVRRMVAAGPAQLTDWGSSGRAYMREHRSRTGSARQLEDLLDALVPPR